MTVGQYDLQIRLAEQRLWRLPMFSAARAKVAKQIDLLKKQRDALIVRQRQIGTVPRRAYRPVPHLGPRPARDRGVPGYNSKPVGYTYATETSMVPSGFQPSTPAETPVYPNAAGPVPSTPSDLSPESVDAATVDQPWYMRPIVWLGGLILAGLAYAFTRPGAHRIRLLTAHKAA